MIEYFIPVGAAFLSLVLGSVGYMIKNVFNRIAELEKRPAVTESQVRQLLADKIDPVKEDVSETRKSIDYLLNLIYNLNK